MKNRMTKGRAAFEAWCDANAVVDSAPPMSVESIVCPPDVKSLQYVPAEKRAVPARLKIGEPGTGLHYAEKLHQV